MSPAHQEVGVLLAQEVLHEARLLDAVPSEDLIELEPIRRGVERGQLAGERLALLVRRTPQLQAGDESGGNGGEGVPSWPIRSARLHMGVTFVATASLQFS